MNYGHGIVVAYVLFIGFVAYIVAGSYQANVDLVTEDYYKAELTYQKHKEAAERSVDAKINLTQDLEHQILILEFAELKETIKGKFQLFRPSNAEYDREFDLETSTEGIQAFPTKGLPNGYYKAKLEYLVGSEAHFVEKPIYLNNQNFQR
jgi:hypothetical protein